MPELIDVSWSEISDYRQCPFKHHLNYRERWQRETTSPALMKGNLWHAVLEQHYLLLQLLGRPMRITGKIPASNAKVKRYYQAIQRLLGRTPDQDPTDLQDLIGWMYDGYVEHYGFDPEWEILHVESKFVEEFPCPWGSPSRFRLKAKLDVVIRWRGGIWLVDHKSGANLPADKELDLDDQFGLYNWIWREMGHKVQGVLYNAARTQRNKGPMALDVRFGRYPLHRTDIELDTIATEAYMTAERMWPATEAGELVIYTPERTPNTDTCRWRCDFTEACLASRKGIRIHDMLNAHGFRQRLFREAELNLLDE